MTYVFEVNAGRVDAAWYWHCSWARTFVDATNEVGRQAAFARVLEIRDSAFFEFGLLGPDREARERVLQRAEEGDLSEFQQIIELNCPERS